MEDIIEARLGEVASPQSQTSEAVASEATHVSAATPPLAHAPARPSVTDLMLDPLRSDRSGPQVQPPPSAPIPHNPWDAMTSDGRELRRCSLHSKWRGVSNVEPNGNGGWKCKRRDSCQLASSDLPTSWAQSSWSSRGHSWIGNPSPWASPPQEPLCWVCASPEHRASQCPRDLPASPPSDPFSCYECGTPGHSEAECPLRREGGWYRCSVHKTLRGSLSVFWCPSNGSWRCRHDRRCVWE
jgi:hypothetical protein